MGQNVDHAYFMLRTMELVSLGIEHPFSQGLVLVPKIVKLVFRILSIQTACTRLQSVDVEAIKKFIGSRKIQLAGQDVLCKNEG